MKNTYVVMAALLIIVLISNLFIIFEINEYREEIAYLRNNISAIKSDVNSSMNSVRNMVNEISEEQRWVTPVKITLGDKKENKQQVNLSWQIKDYTQGSQVNFYYRAGNKNDFQKLVAANTTGSTFVVNLEVPLDFKPEFSIAREYSSNMRQEGAVVKEEKISSRSSLDYEYYIEVQNGENIRASEEEKLYLDKIRHLEFSRIRVNITYVDRLKYSLTVHEEMVGRSTNQLTNVFIKGIDDSGKSFKEEFTPHDKTVFNKTIQFENRPKKTELILEYDTGKNITKELQL